jgi:hypothetical protein
MPRISAQTPTSAAAGRDLLRISPEKVCWLIFKARELRAKEEPEGHYEGSDAVDDGFMAVLERHADDATADELRGFLEALNEDEMRSLFALSALGRGEGDLSDWPSLVARAKRTAPKRLLRARPLADYLEEGLSRLGLSCEPYEIGRL